MPDLPVENRLILSMQGNFSCFFCRLLIFSKSTFLKNSFRNTIRVLNSLDPDQARHFAGPDLGPNCLQRLSAGKDLMTIFQMSVSVPNVFFGNGSLH